MRRALGLVVSSVRGRKANDFDGFPLALSGLHQRADGSEDFLDFPIMRLKLNLQSVKPGGQILMDYGEFAQLDESSHDGDVGRDGQFASQDAREHRNSLLGEHVGQVSTKVLSGWYRILRYHRECFQLAQLEHEIRWESLAISFDLLSEADRLDAVELSQIMVKHDAQATNQEYAALKALPGNQFSAHTYHTPKLAKKFQLEHGNYD